MRWDDLLSGERATIHRIWIRQGDMFLTAQIKVVPILIKKYFTVFYRRMTIHI